MQQRLLNKDDLVFGDLGILRHLRPLDDNWGDKRLQQITISHLLHHRGGWDIDKIGFDPMFATVRIAKKFSRIWNCESGDDHSIHVGNASSI